MASHPEKSSRAKASVQEGTAARLLCEAFGVPFDDADRLQIEIDRVRSRHADTAAERIADAENAAGRASVEMQRLVKERMAALGPVTGVRWQGRNGELVDVGVDHQRGATEFTLKAVKSGSGTLQNLGVKTVVRLFGLPAGYRNLSKVMMDKSVVEVGRRFGIERATELRDLSQDARRKEMTDEELDVCATVARQMLATVADRLELSWAQLTPADRMGVVREVCGGDPITHPDLFFVHVTAKGTSSGRVPFIDPCSVVTLSRGDAGKGYSLIVSLDGTPAFRLTLSCTNGLGVSAFCIRSFDLRSPE